MRPFKFFRKNIPSLNLYYQPHIIDILRAHGTLNRDWRARQYFWEHGIEKSIRITAINPYPDRESNVAIINYMVEHVPSVEYMDERRNEENAIYTGRMEMIYGLFDQLTGYRR